MTEFITQTGLTKLEKEYDQLRRVERPKVVQGISDAAAEGDRSENAEYIYGKKRLREIDRKLKFLGERLKVLKVCHPPINPEVVSFGCFVSYEDEDGNLYQYQIVGSDEFDIKEKKISVDSPVAKALLGKRVDDEVTILRPNGKIEVVITSIKSSQN